MGTKPFLCCAGLMVAGMLLTGCETTPKKTYSSTLPPSNPYASGRTGTAQGPTAWDGRGSQPRAMTNNPSPNGGVAPAGFDPPSNSANVNPTPSTPPMQAPAPQSSNYRGMDSTFGTADASRATTTGMPPALAEQPTLMGPQSAKAITVPEPEPSLFNGSRPTMPPLPKTDDNSIRPPEPPSIAPSELRPQR